MRHSTLTRVVPLALALATATCGTSSKPKQQGAAGSGAGTAGVTGASGATGTGGSTGAAGAGAGAAGAAGAPAPPGAAGTAGPCPDCVPFGLQTRPANPTCVAGAPPPTAYKFVRVWQNVTFTTALDIVPSPVASEMIIAQKSGVALAVPLDPDARRRRRRA